MVANIDTINVATSDLRLLAKAVDAGSLAAASRALGMTKASATRQLQRLEQSLGCLLIHRSGRRFALTEEGRALLPHVLRGLAAIDEGVESILAQGRPLTGTLRIAAPYTYGRKVIGPRLPKFMARHPDLHVALSLGSQHADLLADEADIAIRIGDQGSDSLIARTLSIETFVLAAAPIYLEAAPPLEQPGDLAHHRFVDLRTDPGVRDLMFEGKAGTRRVTINAVLRSNEPEVVVQAACEGTGVAILPRSMVGDYLADGLIVPLLDDWRVPDRRVSALYAPGRGGSPKIRAFLDYLVQEISAAPAMLAL